MKVLTLATAISLATVCQCAAHGTRGTIETDSRVIVARYDDESPMDYCDVNVFSPANGEEAWLSGTTDPNGRFAFCPDTQGVWRVTVDDGMGHRVEMDVECGEDARTTSGEEHHHHTVNRPLGVLIGVAVIFGLFGIISIFKRKGTRCTSPKA